MIIRILGEGQWEVDAAKLADLNELDRHVEHAIKVSDNIEFREALTRLLTEVHEEGTPVPDDVFIESDLVDPRYFSAANIKNRLESYFQMIEQKRSVRKLCTEAVIGRGDITITEVFDPTFADDQNVDPIWLTLVRQAE